MQVQGHTSNIHPQQDIFEEHKEQDGVPPEMLDLNDLKQLWHDFKNMDKASAELHESATNVPTSFQKVQESNRTSFSPPGLAKRLQSALDQSTSASSQSAIGSDPQTPPMEFPIEASMPASVYAVNESHIDEGQEMLLPAGNMIFKDFQARGEVLSQGQVQGLRHQQHQQRDQQQWFQNQQRQQQQLKNVMKNRQVTDQLLKNQLNMALNGNNHRSYLDEDAATASSSWTPNVQEPRDSFDSLNPSVDEMLPLSEHRQATWQRDSRGEIVMVAQGNGQSSSQMSMEARALSQLVQGQIACDLDGLAGLPYDKVIAACAQLRNQSILEKVLNQMLRLGLVPNRDTFELAILLSFSEKDVKLSTAEHWLMMMQKVGHTPSCQAFNHLISGYSCAGDLFGSEQWLSNLIEANVRPDVHSYTAVIRACAKVGDVERSEMWLQRMIDNNIKPDVFSLRCLTDAATIAKDVPKAEKWIVMMGKLGFKPDPSAVNFIISGFAKTGNTSKVEAWLEQMIKAGQVPNLTNMAHLIHQLARSGNAPNLARAESWFESVCRCGLVPDRLCFNSLIIAFAKKGDVQKAEHYLNAMIQDGNVPSLIECSAVIHAYAKAGCVKEAEQWLVKIESMGLVPDEVVYNLVIYASARAGNVARAEHWLWRLLKKGLIPQEISFNTIIGACATAGDLPKAQLWFSNMIGAGLKPNKITFNSLLNTCTQAEDVAEAEKVFELMISSGLAPDIITYGTLCKAHAAKGDFLRVRALMTEVEMQNMTLNEYFYQSFLLACEKAKPPLPKQAQRAVCEMVADGVTVNRSHFATLQRCIGAARAKELCNSLGVKIEANNDNGGKSKGKGKGKGKWGKGKDTLAL
jgi:pentatricopeptide repeat domain-containing protein 1